MDRNKHLLKNNLEGQRENMELLKTCCPLHVIDIGKLLFDYDEEEYEKLVIILGSDKINNWKELIKSNIELVYT